MKNLTKISFLFLGFLLFTFSCNTTKNITKPEESTSFLSQDKLGNIYQISDMKITKYSSDLKPIQSNSIFSNGTISSFDSRNPLQLMLFYKQQQEIILLDNTLSQTNKIDLSFFELVDLACASNRDNSFWLYSITTQSLIKTDKQGKVTNRYENIAQLLERDINPIQLIEYENGQYSGNVITEITKSVRFFNEKVFFRVENDIFSYHLVNFNKKIVFSANHHFDDFEITASEPVFIEKNQFVHWLNYKK